MDINKQYIEMCSEAKEIQELWNYRQGDFFADIPKNGSPDPETKVRLLKDSLKDWAIHHAGWIAWLPRQDQLQGMVIIQDNHGVDNLCALTNGFEMFLRERSFKMECKYMPLTNAIAFTSMEQLWLAFVMKEKWGKRWNGETWEEEENG